MSMKELEDRVTDLEVRVTKLEEMATQPPQPTPYAPDDAMLARMKAFLDKFGPPHVVPSPTESKEPQGAVIAGPL